MKQVDKILVEFNQMIGIARLQQSDDEITEGTGSGPTFENADRFVSSLLHVTRNRLGHKSATWHNRTGCLKAGTKLFDKSGLVFECVEHEVRRSVSGDVVRGE